MSTPSALDTRKLVRGDRCDRCGAQAFVQATMASGLELLFCGHHFSEHEVGLVAQGATVTIDERDTLNEKPSVSANAA
ncbi:MAG TPA: hypothetical protein VGD72_11250 [Mycobacteriales bacterium]|jgi:hypothetical protein